MAVSKADIKFVKSLQLKKFRDESGCFVAEGRKAVEELQKGFVLERLYDETNASAKDIEMMSGMKTPQGVIAVFRCREAGVWSLESGGESLESGVLGLESGVLRDNQLVLVLDGVQDPGNLGTIIRTADWFGIHTIICSKDTADCYNPKVVQATMGALARVEVRYVDLVEWLGKLPQETPIYGTLLEGEDMYQKPLKKAGVIIMGNEGKGISSAVRGFVNQAIRIPSFPADAETSESLNVAIATAIVVAEFRRK